MLVTSLRRCQPVQVADSAADESTIRYRGKAQIDLTSADLDNPTSVDLGDLMLAGRADPISANPEDRTPDGQAGPTSVNRADLTSVSPVDRISVVQGSRDGTSFKIFRVAYPIEVNGRIGAMTILVT